MVNKTCSVALSYFHGKLFSDAEQDVKQNHILPLLWGDASRNVTCSLKSQQEQLECLYFVSNLTPRCVCLTHSVLREVYINSLILSKNEDHKTILFEVYCANQGIKHMSSTWEGVNKKYFDFPFIQSFNFSFILKVQTAVFLCSRFKGRKLSGVWIASIYFNVGRALVPSMWTSIFLRL